MEKHGNGFKDIVGRKFGRLTVISDLRESKDRKALWLCQCECGSEVKAVGKQLRTGKTRSCGCLQIDRARETNTRHGFARKRNVDRLYKIWSSMKGRATNPRNRVFKDYGGRGIGLHQDWLDFDNFKDWSLSNGYSTELTIDRKDNEMGYGPDNCRWTTMEVQGRNKRNNVVFNGETAVEASRRLGGCDTLVASRIRVNGWDAERAFTTKKRKDARTES